MLYYNIDADKHNGTAKKTTLAEFGIERLPKLPKDLTELQIAAYARRKSEARKQYEMNQKSKRGNAKT